VFRFSVIEDEHFIILLQSGKLDEYLDDVISQFWDLPPNLQYETIRYIKEKRIYPSVSAVSSAFGIGEEEGKSLLNNPYKEFLVPVVGEGGGKLVRALAVKDTKELITNQEHLKDSMRVISKFLKEGFALFFDTPFSGESYMLPAVLNLYVENLPKDLIFTGRIDEEGRVYEVNDIPKKRKLAQKENLRFVEPSHIESVQAVKEWFDSDRYDIPFYITKTTENYEGELKSFHSSVTIENVRRVLDLLEILSGISEKELLMITGQLPPDQRKWEEIVREFYKRLKRIESALGSKEVIHLAINGPAALAFACGTIFGSQKPFVIYHWQDNVYHPIEVKKVRYLKERLRSYSRIEWKFEEGGKDLVVILSMAHHDPETNAKEFIKGINPSYLVIRHKSSGNVPVDGMLETARECASLIQDIKAKKSFKDFHFFLSSPVVLSFMLGVAFGYYSPGYVYQHRGENIYLRVIDLHRISEIREGR